MVVVPEVPPFDFPSLSVSVVDPSQVTELQLLALPLAPKLRAPADAYLALGPSAIEPTFSAGQVLLVLLVTVRTLEVLMLIVTLLLPVNV